MNYFDILLYIFFVISSHLFWSHHKKNIYTYKYIYLFITMENIYVLIINIILMYFMFNI